jgi:hypothetical protein
MKYDKFDVRRKLTHPQGEIPEGKQQAGSIKNKYPVYLEDGKTIIFISDKTKEKETIERYTNRGFVKT